MDPSTTSQGGIGFVSAVHTEERKVDIDCIQNSIGTISFFPFISESRLHPHVYIPSDSGTTRSGRRTGRIEFGGGVATAVVTSPPSTLIRLQKRKRNRPKNIYNAIKESRSWLPSAGPHPVLKHLKEGKENMEAGWMRREVKTVLELPSTPIGQLKSPERRLLSRIKDTSSDNNIQTQQYT